MLFAPEAAATLSGCPPAGLTAFGLPLDFPEVLSERSGWSGWSGRPERSGRYSSISLARPLTRCTSDGLEARGDALRERSGM